MNTLYYGDNLDILRRYVKDETVDLIYLDPPFKSNQDYNVLFAEKNGTRAAAQIKAFEDTWEWDKASAEAYQVIVETGPTKVSKVMQCFRTFLGENDMLAYLSMMGPRLLELHRVLKPTGSIYLHCDPTASHYLKLLLDAIFGNKNFRNEIAWHYLRWPAKQKNFQRMHDVILFYSKEYNKNIFNIRYEELSKGTLKRWRGKKSKVEFDGDVRLVTKMTDDDSIGRPADDVWNIPVINSQAKERLGYPTQKPESLLERIIRASSAEGDIVLDPFCGCGTTIAVAQGLKRCWIGVDITPLAITLIRHRLYDSFGDSIKSKYKVIGEPVSLPDAQTLAKEDPYQFQVWALGLVDARPTEQKKGADQGIDGHLYFHDDTKKTKQIIISVKAGRVNVSHIRDLQGVLTREKAEIGVFISLEEPTKPMRKEVASAGFYQSPWGTRHARLQILTIAELLKGKQVDLPRSRGNVTFKKAQRFNNDNSEIQKLPLGK